MKMIQVGGAAVALVMLAIILWAASRSSIADDFSVIADRPWGIVSLVDLYLGLAMAAAWVVYRESSAPTAIAWILALLLLGNLALGVYLFVAGAQAVRHDDVAVLFHGAHAGTSS